MSRQEEDAVRLPNTISGSSDSVNAGPGTPRAPPARFNDPARGSVATHRGPALPPLESRPSRATELEPNMGPGGDNGGGGGDGRAEEFANPAAALRAAALDRLKAKHPHVSAGNYGLTTAELSAICNFDNRTSPALLEKLNSDYGGVEGVAYLLNVDAENGLQLAHPNLPSLEKTGLHTSNTGLTKLGEKPPSPPKPVHKSKKVAPYADDDLAKAQTEIDGKNPEMANVDMAPADKDIRQSTFGKNVIPPPPSDTILEIVWDTIKDDPIIKVLIVGAVVVLALETALCPSTGWIEGLAILVAVVIVLSVTAGNDWSKDRKFKKLLLLQSDKRTKVIRGGHKDQVSSWDVCVGDLVEVVVGDEIPADGIYVRGNRLVVDESPLTGESVPVKKGDFAPYMFSGCQVSEGSGVMLVTAVGPRSSGGQIQELLNEAQSEETVLQQKLKVVAVLIGKIGVASGILTFLGLAIRWAINWGRHIPPESGGCRGVSSSETLARIEKIVEDFVIGITVVVVAVPEGLPLAVTISLAFSMFKMIQDKCFVRHLDASETMGEATCICTDKTGTLTENRMTVVKSLVGDQVFYGEGSGEEHSTAFSPTTFDDRLRDVLCEGIAANSTCFVKYEKENALPVFVGSATEGALLVFTSKLGTDYEQLRKNVRPVENGTWSFSSDRKRMSTLVEPAVKAHASAKAAKYRLYTKGASEIVLSLCTHIVDSKGKTITPITPGDTTRIQRTIKRWASQGLRTLALAYRDTDQALATFEGASKKDDPEHDLVFIGLVGIKDPLRKEVPGAVAVCQKAGLTIRMVTGDNILTACKIARECNIMYGDGVALEGPVFRAMSEEEKINVIPRLQVLARSSPADKHTLVSLLKKLGEVVAVTGDGTNDAPALKEADVGFAMGISGTQIAMNASDIVLLDDNFVSLVQSIRWGRNVLNCVRKFLQFQLGVNLVAIVLTFVGAVTVGDSPLSTVQLLWVNLIMDSLGALALASDDPDDDILLHPPHSRHEHLLSRPMREYIFFQLVYQTVVLLTILLKGDDLMPPDRDHHSEDDVSGDPTKRTKTLVFTTFILCQVTNEICARQLTGELNLFKNFFRNRLFVLIMIVIIAVQVVVVLVGQSFFNTSNLTGQEWVLCILLAIGNLPWVFFTRCLSKAWHKWRGTEFDKPLDASVTPASSHPALGHPTNPTDPQRPTNPYGAEYSPRSSTSHLSLSIPPQSRRASQTPSRLASNKNLTSNTSLANPYKPTHRAGKRWQTVRSAVVLMGQLETIRDPEYVPRGPDSAFMENWMRFRKDTTALPTKGAGGV
ncbi:Calcium-transporting ATPase 10, plasma membrane-type [Rhizophlyctis rosea]|uniref:Calcium-transporting ATPase n=1 Tax=Rhizophlyctis rosea TaxID=64517 RepID=A0AAD5S4L4_9FUNG|nr:Calcium-transporting ATPase 10, plasma membrane-type [Rhizophlyctis rosea]